MIDSCACEGELIICYIFPIAKTMRLCCFVRAYVTSSRLQDYEVLDSASPRTAENCHLRNIAGSQQSLPINATSSSVQGRYPSVPASWPVEAISYPVFHISPTLYAKPFAFRNRTRVNADVARRGGVTASHAVDVDSHMHRDLPS